MIPTGWPAKRNVMPNPLNCLNQSDGMSSTTSPPNNYRQLSDPAGPSRSFPTNSSPRSTIDSRGAAERNYASPLPCPLQTLPVSFRKLSPGNSPHRMASAGPNRNDGEFLSLSKGILLHGLLAHFDKTSAVCPKGIAWSSPPDAACVNRAVWPTTTCRPRASVACSEASSSVIMKCCKIECGEAAGLWMERMTIGLKGVLAGASD